ncbi:MAG TPA: hypothetical protein VKB63_04110 [Gemmatimonadales bacterium]|nr:hypothetical protein [Gemmatimonadales bacterium]
MSLRSAGIGLMLVGVSACAADRGVGPGPQPQCASGVPPLSLGVGQYRSIDPAVDSGCVAIAVNSSVDSAEYLLVAQAVTGQPGLTASFALQGQVRQAAMAAGSLSSSSTDLAQRFHDGLREMERRHSYGGMPLVADREPAAPSRVPPDSGSSRHFSVCANLDCSSFAAVTATAAVVRGPIAIFVDTAAPSPGLTQADLDSVADELSTRLYAVDTAAFGRESDIDSNQVIIVLMTPVVNRLVTPLECATSGYVSGFFLGGDIDPALRGDARFNQGEIVYSLVADSLGTVSCPHRPSRVKQLFPVTFVHELQHMISFNQHVLLRSGPEEELWLNEALSHFAEELGGRSFGIATTQFSTFAIGDVRNAYQYLEATGSNFLVTTSGIGSLAERGAGWLFVRYLDDRFRSDTSLAATAAFTRGLLETSRTGAANVAARTGVGFDTLVAHWALANFVSDLDTVAAFQAPPELTYTSWRLRATYRSLHLQDPATFPAVYPLAPPATSGPNVAVSGTLRSGSGVYVRAVQAPGAPGFTLRLAAPGGGPLSAAVAARLGVIRIR